MNRSLSDIRASLEVEGEPETTAGRVAEALRLNATQRELLWPILLGFCATVERGRVRAVEHRAGRLADRTAERQALLCETFSLPDGRRVVWGEATVADHEERIAMLAALRDGIGSTIERHRQAIAELVKLKVSCLFDLEQVAA